VRAPIDPVALRQPQSPYDSKLSLAAAAWLGELPPEVAPTVLASQFPRIVNRLSRFWDSPRMIDDYFQQLLMDRRGKRKGFSKKILDELTSLAQYHRALHKSDDKTDVWEAIPYRKVNGA
jgi:hypothetical protein